MKKKLRGIVMLLLTIALVVGAMLMSHDPRLKASEDDGNISASEQQQEAKEESKPVVIDIPKREEPEETSKEEPKEESKEEPAEGPVTEAAEEAPTDAEEPEQTPESIEEIKAEQPAEEAAKADGSDSSEDIGEDVTEVRENDAHAEIRMENKGSIHYGDTVKLRADITGIEGDYSIRWQYNDGDSWKDLNQYDTVYSFVLDESNNSYRYRVIVDY